MSLVIITINYNTIECATQIFFNIEMFISAKVHSKPFKTYRSYKQLNEEKFFAILLSLCYAYICMCILLMLQMLSYVICHACVFIYF
jgi:hypothetical protein